MNRDRLFRVLFHLQHESDYFLLAQDAYSTLSLCCSQITTLPGTIADYEIHAAQSIELQKSYAPVIERAQDLLAVSGELIAVFSNMMPEALSFWLCCPVDHTEASFDKSANLWNIHHSRAVAIPENMIVEMKMFQQRCGNVISTWFRDALQRHEAEKVAENSAISSLDKRSFSLLNAFSMSNVNAFDLTNCGKMYIAARFPTSHYSLVDENFSKLIARLFTIPIGGVAVNTLDLDQVVTKLNSHLSVHKTVLTYRNARRKILVIHWEIASQPINGAFTAIGVDITHQLASNRAKQDSNMQRILRQWLHSIRNASFEQQAEMLLDDFKELQLAIGDAKHDAQFSSLCDGLKTLIHTAKTSVGLINQALDTKGLVQLVSVTDFLNSLSSFPINFASSEGIGVIPVLSVYTLDGARVVPADVSKVLVKCDMINLQAFMDNIISNAVRYTNPTKGVEVHVNMTQSDVMMRFKITIVDFCSGGLPDAVFDFFKKRIGVLKCLDVRHLSEPRKRKLTEMSVTGCSVGSSDSVSSLPYAESRSAAAGSEGTASHSLDSIRPVSPPLSTRPSKQSSKFRLVTTAAHTLRQSDHGASKSDISVDKINYGYSQISPGIKGPTSSYPDKLLSSPDDPTLNRSHILYNSDNTAQRSSDSNGTRRIAAPDQLHVGKGRSSGTGLPHLFDLYQLLTNNGEDFDLMLSTGADGTSIQIVFNGYLNEAVEEPDATRRTNRELKGRLLVADDSAVIRKIICKYLDTLGLDYHVCKDGMEALHWFEANHTKCSGIITDLEMPRLGGDALITRAKAINSAVPCFIVSGISLNTLPPGCERAVVKPLSLDQVVSMVEDIYKMEQMSMASVETMT